MKHFLRYVTIGLVPVIIFCFAAEYTARCVPNPYKYKYEWMQANAADVETLVFGSSHAYYGISPRLLGGKAFSLANVSQTPEIDEFLLKYWESDYKQLKTVIYPISAFTWFVGEFQKNDRAAYLSRYYSIYMDYHGFPCTPFYNLELGELFSARVKFEQYILGMDVREWDDYGMGPHPLADKDMVLWNSGVEGRQSAERHLRDAPHNSSDTTPYLYAIADFCKQHAIRLILVTTPCWHTYYDLIPATQLETMHQLTHRLQTEYNLTYFDYMKDERFVAEDFFDSNHLSDVGAEKFTNILKKDIENLE